MFQHFPTIFVVYFLVIQHSFLNMVIELVDLHSKNGDFPVCKLLVYQRAINDNEITINHHSITINHHSITINHHEITINHH